ncbi:DEAD2 domain-containing protein [Ditylenchus destructor]|uniref:DEAD2 domain-containing protein n=1 Tax=Ditylenchus destructor TaxID=166010 RepID=A0AAD4NAT4_9BILA|nr:DEAD2 domain-containing protein [Ditylenchus destructor]
MSRVTNTEPILIGDNLRVEFPYVPYDCQQSFMKKVVEALNSNTNAALESPTGTGKTLSLLCAAIAWVQREKERLKPTLPQTSNVPGLINAVQRGASKIFYASRTHSQLQQVIRELNKTTYRSLIKVATLAGRDQLCINEKVIKEQNTEIKGHICRSLVNNRKCHYYNMWEKSSDDIDAIYQAESGGQAMDIEDLVTVAQKHMHCPFYRSRQLAAYEIKLKGNIVIFDEAHNLESAAEESVSIDFSTKTLSLCIRECDRVISLIEEEEEAIRAEMDNCEVSFASLMHTREKKESKDSEKKLTKQDVAELLDMIHKLEEQFASLDMNSGRIRVANLPGCVFPGNQMITLLERASIKRDLRDRICKLIDNIGFFLAKNAQRNSGIWAERGTNLAEFSNFIAKVLVDTYEGAVGDFQQTQRMPSCRLFQLYVIREESGAMKFRYWCFSAGLAMRFLASRGVRSIILASGTLSPMSQFVSTMGIPFGSLLENKHAAGTDQLIVGVVSKGPDGCDVDGSYKNRNDQNYKNCIGNILLQTAQSTPQGVLVFFPSYRQLHAFVDHWKQPIGKDDVLFWSVLERHKRIFVEPVDKTEVKAVFREFDTVIREGDPNRDGAIFLAVCRGKLSEGIDFSDSHCRAVVIVGIPFPPLFEARIILKKAFLMEQRKHDQSVINPEYWYQVEGVRAVNQALGRIIRHKDDFGAVILADSRYASMDRKLFPAWLRPAVKNYAGTMSLFTEIKRFFVERGVLVVRSHLRLQEEFNQQSSATVKRRRRQIQLCENVDPTQQVLENDVAEFNEIIGMYGLSNLSQTFTSNDDNTLKTSQQASINAPLRFIIAKLSAVPSPEKVFPKKLMFPNDAMQSASHAIVSCGSQSSGNSAEQTQPAKKRIKLKTNWKINDSVTETKAAQPNLDMPTTSWSAQNITQRQNLIYTSQKALSSLCANPRNLMLRNPKAYLDHTKLLNANDRKHLDSIQANATHNSSGDPLVIDMSEYKAMLYALGPVKRRKVLSAQRAYSDTQELDPLITELCKTVLPDNPSIFTGFYTFIRKPEHKAKFKKVCYDYKLLSKTHPQ